jgi:hypothetical protein
MQPVVDGADEMRLDLFAKLLAVRARGKGIIGLLVRQIDTMAN